MELFPQKIENKFTSRLKSVIKIAENISREFSHEFIDVEHIIFGIASQKGSIGSNVIKDEKFDFKNLYAVINNMPKTKNWEPKFSEELKNIFKKSVLIASHYKHSHIGTEHLLYAVLTSGSKKSADAFYFLGVDAAKLKEQLKALLDSESRFSEMVDFLESSLKGQKLNSPFGPMPGSPNGALAMEMSSLGIPAIQKQSALEYFCRDLVREAEEGFMEPVIGRKEEIEKVINVLCRKTKNNPILIGEPGVGKTAVVQGLSQKIFEGNVPIALLNKRIYSLDLGLLVAGTVFRGEFEARLKDVIGEIQENPNAILFIDEIHTIIGAGSTGGAGSLDAANILKPSLSRGEISCIGSTTLDEYRKHFKKDAALERRFQSVLIEEPDKEETKKMLLGLKDLYEAHHNLRIEKEAVEAAVELSVRFINDRFLPDKAFDVLDEAAALTRSRYAGKNYFKEIRKLEEEKRFFQTAKEKAVEEERYDEALSMKEKESELEKNIARLYKIQEEENREMIKTPVTGSDVAEVVTRITGVPVKKLVSEEKTRLKNLEKEMKSRIVGQDEAVEAISKSIRRSRAGIGGGKRPMGVFLFLGPTGVGKTELAKVLAQVMYKNPKALIKVDMSEFMEKHNVSRLVGAPAGYIGYEEGGKLTEQIKLHPYSIILFDEIEKAHPDVFNLLLQIFEDGELTDAAGKKADFKNTIIIMTSNIGTSELTEEASWGFAAGSKKLSERNRKEKIRNKYIKTKDGILKELKEELRPEFINRIDKILVFNPLSFEDIKAIAKIQLDDLKNSLLENNGLKLAVDKKALDYIAQKSFNPNEGARLIRRNLQEMVEDLISEKVIDGEIKEGDGIKLMARRGKTELELANVKISD